MPHFIIKFWIAKFLVLVMLVPVFGPLALAHAAPIESMQCARRPLAESRARRPAMHCHEGLAQNGVAGNAGPVMPEPGASFRSLECCSNHDCCRAVKTSDWARPASNFLSLLGFQAEPAFHRQLTAHNPMAFTGPDSTRAPPIS